MKAFAELFAELENAVEAGDKTVALKRYLSNAPPEDAAWAIVLMARQGPKRIVTPRRLRQWSLEDAGIPGWLFTACRQAVTDLAETAALLQRGGSGSQQPLHAWLEDRLLPLGELPTAEVKIHVLKAWTELDERQLLVWNKLLIGTLKPPVTPRQLAKALAGRCDASVNTLTQRLRSNLEPTAQAYRSLLAPETATETLSDPGAPEPRHLDTVLLYAQRGRGRRAAFYCDLTLGLWKGDTLVPFARTDRGLDDEALRRVDAFVRRHVVERFGPVRAVESQLVFTVAFDGVEAAPRRKSGLKVLSPRITAWKENARPEDADALSAAHALLLS